MTAPRDAVVVEGKGKTKAEPTVRFMAAGDPQFAEHFAWDLSGYNVTPAVSGPLTVPATNGAVQMANLRDLEHLQGRKAVFDRKNLRARAHGNVSATVKVSAGNMTFHQVFPERVDFVPLDTKKPAFESGVRLADVIDVAVKLPTGPPELKIQLRNGPRSSVITIQTIEIQGGQPVPSPNGSATVTFTNLCSRVPQSEKFDLEFGQYYELLAKPNGSGSAKGRSSTRANRLIPKPFSDLGSGGDCNDGAIIPF
jgi:hypothetical protein